MTKDLDMILSIFWISTHNKRWDLLLWNYMDFLFFSSKCQNDLSIFNNTTSRESASNQTHNQPCYVVCTCVPVITKSVDWLSWTTRLVASWRGDFLLPEALRVITVEEDLSAAAAPVWSFPRHVALLSLLERSQPEPWEVIVSWCFSLLNSFFKLHSSFALRIHLRPPPTAHTRSYPTVNANHRSMNVKHDRRQIHWFSSVPLKRSPVLAQATYLNNWDSRGTLGWLVPHSVPELVQVKHCDLYKVMM